MKSEQFFTEEEIKEVISRRDELIKHQERGIKLKDLSIKQKIIRLSFQNLDKEIMSDFTREKTIIIFQQIIEMLEQKDKTLSFARYPKTGR